jgi:hypothetical protein
MMGAPTTQEEAPMASRKNAAPKLKPITISSLELMALETSRASLSLLRRQVKESDERVKAMEADLVARLEAGARIEGDARAMVQEEAGNCSPSWKTHYLDHMLVDHNIPSEEAEADVRDATEVRMKKTLVIVVGG